MYRIVPDLLHRNRAYVIDDQLNKVYYDTTYKCYKFVSYMEEKDDEKSHRMLEMVRNKGSKRVSARGR